MTIRWTLAAACLATFGCKKDRNAAPYDPCYAKGVVTLDGKPLPSGMVTFVPQIPESAGGHPGIASIGADGGYELGNAEHGRAKALKPGEYVVMVVAMEIDRANGKPTPKLALPPEYADAFNSPLRVTLPPGQNSVDLKLTR
jgi:hypothetical protein